MRERDLRLATDDEHYKYMAYEQFTRLNKKAWPVIESNTKNAVSDARRWVEECGREYDYVFFDLPGTMNDRDLIHTVAQMDYVIAPMAADRTVMESTLRYVVSLQKHLLGGNSNIKGLYMLWNMVDGRERSELYGIYELICTELQLPILKTFIPNSLRFRREQSEVRREVSRSTLFPIDKSFAKTSNIDALTDELIELFK
jgi:cellulose biosynthesis protein BcsQ